MMEKKKHFKNGTYTGERALYATHNAIIEDCIFEDGESPLKESSHLDITSSTFRWKYPLWYGTKIVVKDSVFEEMARSGIWYTSDITIINSKIDAPKLFRRAKHITIKDCDLLNAVETMWNCTNVELENMHIVGDYFGLNCVDVRINNIVLDGNYAFDGGKNIIIKNSILNSKDSFWNCENITVINSKIIGEYLAWNSKNITFIDCEIESNQGICYSSNVKLVNCKLNNTDLCFEYCDNVDADIITPIISVKNVISGRIKSGKIGEIIMDDKLIDPTKTIIEDDR